MIGESAEDEAGDETMSKFEKSAAKFDGSNADRAGSATKGQTSAA